MGKADQRSAQQFVADYLQGLLPPGTPPNWREIDGAKFVGFGQHVEALANLTMVDGLRAKVCIRRWSRGMLGHRWIDWEGEALFFENGAWQREEACNTDDGTCRRCGCSPRGVSGLCATCLDEDEARAALAAAGGR